MREPLSKHDDDSDLEQTGECHQLAMNARHVCQWCWWGLVGINTFTEGYGGRFGDSGGGVLVEPYADWIVQTTGIPEPGTAALIVLGAVAAAWRRSMRRADAVPPHG